MRRVVLASLVLGLLPAAGLAQSEDDRWNSLRELRAGQKLQVVNTDLKKIKGRFVGVTEEGISLRVSGKELTVARPEVTMVTISPPSRRNHMLLGMLMGSAIGFGIWAQMDNQARYYGTGEGPSGQTAAILAGGGAAVGGLLFGRGPKEGQIIYLHDPTRPASTRRPELETPPAAPAVSEGDSVFVPPQPPNIENPSPEVDEPKQHESR